MIQFLGTWMGSQLVPGSWQTRKMISTNKWLSDFNFALLKQNIQRAVMVATAPIIKDEMDCRIARRMNLLLNVALACDPTANAEESIQQIVSKSAAEISCRESMTIAAGEATVKFGDASITNCTSSAFISFGNVAVQPNTQIDTTTIEKLTKLYLSKRFTKRQSTSGTGQSTAECYALVTNQKKAYVGQLLGDCSTLTSSTEFSNVEICLPLKSSIPYDLATYSDYNIVTYSEDANGEPVYSADENEKYSVTYVNEQLCFTLSSTTPLSATLCPGKLSIKI
jgi:hypothetical protein